MLKLKRITFKHLKVDRLFIIFIFLISAFPILFLIFSGSFFDCICFKNFEIKSFVSGRFQKKINLYLKNNTPIYSKICYIKPNIDVLTRQGAVNDVYLQNKDLIKITKGVTSRDDWYFFKAIENFVNMADSLYFIILPSKFHLYGRRYFNDFTGYDFYKREDWFNYNFCDEYRNIFKLDESVLLNRIDDISPFYRTSSRLNGFGAYILYNEIMNSFENQAYELSNFNVCHVVDDYFGELYSKNFKNLVAPDTIDVFKCDFLDVNVNVREYFADGSVSVRSDICDLNCIKSPDKLDVVFGKVAPVKVVETNLKDKDSILIFADENVNSLVQFLSLHCKKIVVVYLNEFLGGLSQKFYSNIGDIKFCKYDKIMFFYGVESISNREMFFNMRYFKPDKFSFTY